MRASGTTRGRPFRMACAGALGSAVFCLAASGAWSAPADDCNSDMPDKMIAGCTEVLKNTSDPETKAAAFARRGFAHKQHNECEPAIADFTEALRMTANNVAILLLRGECQAAANRPNDAATDFQAALKIDPGNGEAAAAIDQLGPRAAAASPASGGARAAGGADDCNSDEPDKMIAGCTALLMSEGDPVIRVPALIRRGAAYKDKRECERAIADFDEALRLAPNTAAALALRGQTSEMLGRSRTAADVNAALQIDPNVPGALGAMAGLPPPGLGSALPCALLALPPKPGLEQAETPAVDQPRQSPLVQEASAEPTPDVHGVVQSIGGASRFRVDNQWIELFGIDDPTTKGQHISAVYTYLKPTDGIVACYRRPGNRYQCYTGGEDLAVLALRNGFGRLRVDAPPEYRSLTAERPSRLR